MSFFKEFQELRKILCICPSCMKIARITDLKLKTKEPIEKTWLDEYEEEVQGFEKKEYAFTGIEDKLIEEARKKGRRKAKRAFNKAISPSLRKCKYDPHDIKPILYPIDYVVFHGMTLKRKVDNIVFLSKKLRNPRITELRNQVQKVIMNEQYDFLLTRIGEKGNITFE